MANGLGGGLAAAGESLAQAIIKREALDRQIAAQQEKALIQQQQRDVTNSINRHKILVQNASNSISENRRLFWTNESIKELNNFNRLTGRDREFPLITAEELTANSKLISRVNKDLVKLGDKVKKGDILDEEAQLELNNLFEEIDATFVDAPSSVAEQIKRTQAAIDVEPEAFTLGPGQQRFIQQPGQVQATQIAAVPPGEPKPPTISNVQAQFLTQALTGQIDFKNLTEGQQFVMGTLQKGGFQLDFDPETGRLLSIASGARAEAPQQPTPAFRTQVQKEAKSAADTLQGLITLKSRVTPESFGITSLIAKGLQEAFEFIAPGTTPKKIGKLVEDRDKLFRQSAEDFALWVKNLTGVQFGEKEARRLSKGFPNQADNFAEFNNKLDGIIDDTLRSIVRLRKFDIPKNPRDAEIFFNSVPLSLIDDSEVEALKQELGIDTTQAAPQQTAQPTEVPDVRALSDEDLLGQLGVQ